MKSICRIDGIGNKFWVIPNTENDKLSCSIYGVPHREDGPAIEWDNCDIFWYLNDEFIKPTFEMMSKYIRLNPDNILKDYEYPLEIQVLAINLKRGVFFNIIFPHEKLKELYPKLFALKDSGLI